MNPSVTANHSDDVLSAFTPAPTSSCLFCGRRIQLRHRQTKKFCGDLCRSRFHYARKQEEQANLKQRINEAAEALRTAQTMLD